MQCTAESRPPPKHTPTKVGVTDHRDFHRCFQDCKHSGRLCFVLAVCGSFEPGYWATRYAGLCGPNAGRPGVWATPVEKLIPSWYPSPVPGPLEFSLSLACQCIVGTNPIRSPFSVRTRASSFLLVQCSSSSSSSSHSFPLFPRPVPRHRNARYTLRSPRSGFAGRTSTASVN
jgi:hypothetical protein